MRPLPGLSNATSSAHEIDAAQRPATKPRQPSRLFAVVAGSEHRQSADSALVQTAIHAGGVFRPQRVKVIVRRHVRANQAEYAPWFDDFFSSVGRTSVRERLFVWRRLQSISTLRPSSTQRIIACVVVRCDTKDHPSPCAHPPDAPCDAPESKIKMPATRRHDDRRWACPFSKRFMSRAAMQGARLALP